MCFANFPHLGIKPAVNVGRSPMGGSQLSLFVLFRIQLVFHPVRVKWAVVSAVIIRPRRTELPQKNLLREFFRAMFS